MFKYISTKHMSLSKSQSRFTAHTCYWLTDNYELWSLFEDQSLVCQLRTFQPCGKTKIYSQRFEFENKSQAESIFQAICENESHSVKVDAAEIFISQHPHEQSVGQQIGSKGFVIKLKEMRGGPTLDQWMLIKMMNDDEQQKIIPRSKTYTQIPFKSFSLHKNSENYIEKQMEQIETVDSILHESKNYRFQAYFNPSEKQIQTMLTVRDPQHTSRKKEYKSNIKEQKWGRQYKEIFQSIQNLFEHMRSQENYEVIESKGTIRIKNEPENSNELQILKNKVKIRKKQKIQSRRSSFAKTRPNNIADFSKSATNMFSNYNELETAVFDKLKISEEMDEIGKKIERNLMKNLEELRNEEKQIKSQNQKNNQQRLTELVNLETKLKNQFKGFFEEELNKAKAEFRLLIHYESEKNFNKETAYMQIKKVLEEERERGKSVERGKESLKQIQIDQLSSQISKFQLKEDHVVTYKGPWEWTQIFIKTKIPHDKVTVFSFKIRRSIYNAIAIGVSDRSNINERSSLSLGKSIAYWGDREVWEGSKVKEEGQGFKAGEKVTMEVDLFKGIIKWIVNDLVRAEHQSRLLLDRSMNFLGYIQMYDKEDEIQLLQYCTLDS